MAEVKYLHSGLTGWLLLKNLTPFTRSAYESYRKYYRDKLQSLEEALDLLHQGKG